MPLDRIFSQHDQSSQLGEAQQREVQQERLRALGQMASGMAHEINNSLTPIIGFSDYLLDSKSGLPEEARQCLEFVRTAAGDISHLVEQVRQFYRRRDESESLEAVDLNRLARQVLEVTRPRWQDIPRKEAIAIEIETELDPNSPRVSGNESELREALTNLVLNGAEAMPQGGTLTVATRLIESTPRAGDARVILTIHDTGIGMDELTRQRCLEPFFTTKGPRRSGLGLATVYGIMRRHEGAIDIESQAGKGTTVHLVFTAAEDGQNTTLFSSPNHGLPPLRILCIDDDPLIGSMLHELLTSQKHAVEIAADGSQGLDAFRQARQRGQPFQVVITDLGMPTMDGWHIVQTIKNDSPGTPVIVLTAWMAMMGEEGELPKAADAVLSKPPNMDRLYQALAQVTLAKADVA